MSIKIKENWTRDDKEPRQTAAFPAYNIYPGSDWNYAVAGDEDYEVVKNEIPENPWWRGYPYEIKLKARRLNNWGLEVIEIPAENNTNEGIDAKQISLGATRISDSHLELTPGIPDSEFVKANLGAEEEITLVPYGCTQLRLTVFPKI